MSTRNPWHESLIESADRLADAAATCPTVICRIYVSQLSIGHSDQSGAVRWAYFELSAEDEHQS